MDSRTHGAFAVPFVPAIGVTLFLLRYFIYHI